MVRVAARATEGVARAAGRVKLYARESGLGGMAASGVPVQVVVRPVVVRTLRSMLSVGSGMADSLMGG
jgi:hypothetical protein